MTNRELDALNKWIAVNVFKWEERDAYHGSKKLDGITFWVCNGRSVTGEKPAHHHRFPKYTEGEHFRELLEKCAEECPIGLEISRNESLWFISRPDQDSTESAIAETLPLAICQFAFVLFGGDTKKS